MQKFNNLLIVQYNTNNYLPLSRAVFKPFSSSCRTEKKIIKKKLNIVTFKKLCSDLKDCIANTSIKYGFTEMGTWAICYAFLPIARC